MLGGAKEGTALAGCGGPACAKEGTALAGRGGGPRMPAWSGGEGLFHALYASTFAGVASASGPVDCGH